MTPEREGLNRFRRPSASRFSALQANEIDTVDGKTFIAMAFIEGESLDIAQQAATIEDPGPRAGVPVAPASAS